VELSQYCVLDLYLLAMLQSMAYVHIQELISTLDQYQLLVHGVA
jgi:hypothetical protein